MSVDKAALLAFLTPGSEHKNPLVGAVYAGLISRITRGEFDEDETS